MPEEGDRIINNYHVFGVMYPWDICICVPNANGITSSFLKTFPSESRNLSGRNTSLSGHNSLLM